MSGFPEVFFLGAAAAPYQIVGEGSARWFSKIIRTHGVTLHDYPEDIAWQR